MMQAKPHMILPKDVEIRHWLSLIDKIADVPIYLIGGIVRESLLGMSSTDYDVVMEQDALILAQTLVETYGGELVTHERFRTATWYPPNFEGYLDLISARDEQYAHPAALPDVALSDLGADAVRRDFSINTLRARYVDNNKYLIIDDPCGGLADLEVGVVRVLHDQSFVDDPTRIFRAVRYVGRLGFRFEEETERLLREGIGGIELLSGARVWHELERVAAEPNRAKIFALLMEYGILDKIMGGLRWDSRIADVVAYVCEETELHLVLEAWLAGNDAGLIPHLRGRLGLSNEVVDVVTEAQALVAALENVEDDEPKPSILTHLIESITSSRKALALVSALTYHAREFAWVSDYQTDWAGVSPEINGDMLKEMRVTPGPIYGEILRRVRDGILDGEISGFDQEKELVERLLGE